MSIATRVEKIPVSTSGDTKLQIEFTDPDTGLYEVAYLPWYPDALGALIEGLQRVKQEHAPEYEQLQLFDPKQT